MLNGHCTLPNPQIDLSTLSSTSPPPAAQFNLQQRLTGKTALHIHSPQKT